MVGAVGVVSKSGVSWTKDSRSSGIVYAMLILSDES